LFAVVSGFLSSKQPMDDDVRKQVSGACLKELVSGRVPHEA